MSCVFFFFNDTATTEIYTLSLHDALPICSFTTIDVPGACCSGAEGINDSGQIVGRFTDNTSYTTHGFLRSPDGSNFTIIDVPGASSTYAYGVNGAGQVVGSFQDARGGHGFLRDTDGSFTTIDVPGAMSSEANGINATGQIVGTFQGATGDHGFLGVPTPASRRSMFLARWAPRPLGSTIRARSQGPLPTLVTSAMAS